MARSGAPQDGIIEPEWWVVSSVYTRARLALWWKWVVRRPCNPPPPPRPASRGPASRRRVAASEGLPRPKRRCAGGDWAWGPQTAQSPLDSAFLAAARCLATKTRRAGGGGWRRPEPRLDGPDKWDRVRRVAFLYLEFMLALTPPLPLDCGQSAV